MGKPRKQVKDLPKIEPGTTVTIPLDCLPEYLALHGLQSTGYDERTGALIVVPLSQEATDER